MFHRGRHDGSQDHGAAVRAQLDNVLPGVGARRGEQRGDHPIGQFAGVERRKVARRGSRGPVSVVSAPAMVRAAGPLIRTTPMPPRPGGVAIATMVSVVENTPTRSRYLRAEMYTVFEKASPMLSLDTPGTSATARCTMRRS